VNTQAWFRLPDGPTLRSILGWALLIDLLFLPIYLGCNWLTQQREGLLQLYLPAELAIPLAPWAIWPYLSMFLLFCLPLFTLPRERARNEALAAILGLLVAAVIWLLLPARLGFERVEPAGYEALYGLIFVLDAPHNLVPSLHLIFSTLVVLACGRDAPRPARIGLWVWLVCIAASTLLTHQHHLLDVASGFVVALVCRNLVQRLAMRQNLFSIPLVVREDMR
jgi:membrane-associated phospholipid phosphatase